MPRPYVDPRLRGLGLVSGAKDYLIDSVGTSAFCRVLLAVSVSWKKPPSTTSEVGVLRESRLWAALRAGISLCLLAATCCTTCASSSLWDALAYGCSRVYIERYQTL